MVNSTEPLSTSFKSLSDRLLHDRRLKANELLALQFLPLFPANKKGGHEVTAVELGFYLRVTHATAARVLRKLHKVGYLHVRKIGTGRGGGFRVWFKNTAASILVLLGTSSALHKQNYSPNCDHDSSLIHIISTRRRKSRQTHRRRHSDVSTKPDQWHKDCAKLSFLNIGEFNDRYSFR